MSHGIQKNPGGNTKPPDIEERTLSKQKTSKNQLYVWTFTMDFSRCPSASQLSQLLKGFCKKFIFSKEQGKEKSEKHPNGYMHWQGAISLINKEYFATVANLFPYGTHIEGARCAIAAFKYCEKEDSTHREGPYTEKSIFLKIITNLFPWQEDVVNLIKTDPDDRSIHWYYDPSGGKGKTQLCKYLAYHYKAVVLSSCATKDLAMAIPEFPTIIIFNQPRTSEDYFNYGALESLKDGLIFSCKYESKMKIFNSPHVIVFSNYMPKLESMTKDRWIIHNL